MRRNDARIRQVYRRLLRLYPAEFRGEFASEMARQFADEYREAEDPGARRRLALRAVIDVLMTAPVELARGLRNDLLYALRVYRSSAGASLGAVAVLAIGMAFVTAFISLYVDLVLRPHAGFEDGGRIVSVGYYDGPQAGRLPGATLDRIAAESVTLETAAGAARFAVRIRGASEPVNAEVVTREFFSGLRPKLALGRGLEPREHAPDGERSAVISHRYWQQALGARADVLGTIIPINLTPPPGRGAEPDDAAQWQEFRIVGVTAAEFEGVHSPQPDLETAVWLPFEQYYEAVVPEPGAPDSVQAMQLRIGVSFKALGRRADGASARAIASELNARFVDESLAAVDWPAPFSVLDGLVYDPRVQRATQRQLQLFLGASVLLALVAAANVSLFLLARAPGRRRELGIRMAVGAPVGRLARQLATEAGLLVLVAAALGIALSVWLAEFLRNLEFLRRAQWRDITLLDWRVLLTVSLLLAALTLLVSLAPILGLKRGGIAAASQRVSARAGLAQRVAGNAQIAVAGTLGGAALAFAWYLGSLHFGDPGYATRDLQLVRFSIDSAPYFAAREPGFPGFFVDQARRREAIAALPGVSGVSLASAVPGMPGGLQTVYLQDPDRPLEQTSFNMVVIDGSYVDLLGLPLLYGRAPRNGEPDVVLVNQSLARQFWGRDDVVGERLGTGVSAVDVVGVLADLPFGHPAAAAEPRAFASWTQQIPGVGAVLVRTEASSAELRGQIEELIRNGALELEIRDVSPLRSLRNELLAADRGRGFVTIVTAALVVLLAAFGFYGTERYLVAAGRREYAIRASMGAGPRALGRLVISRGLAISLPGLVIGALLALVLVAWLNDEYVSSEVSAGIVTLWVVVGLTAILLAASAGPARQARRTQPAPLLREE